jgi:hypothetical protein
MSRTASELKVIRILLVSFSPDARVPFSKLSSPVLPISGGFSCPLIFVCDFLSSGLRNSI